MDLSSKASEKRNKYGSIVSMAEKAMKEDMVGDKFDERNDKRRKMSEFDQRYFLANIKKHGENYKKMERDTEKNYFQYSEAKMKKSCELFLSLSEDERMVEG